MEMLEIFIFTDSANTIIDSEDKYCLTPGCVASGRFNKIVTASENRKSY